MLVPKLRFKREDGTDYPDWKSKQLHSIFIERNETQTITEDAPLLSFTIEQGVINPEEKKTNKRDFLIKDKDNKKYALTEYNDIIYNPANLKFGAIHRNKLGRGVVSPIYAIFQTDENPVFMEYIVTNPVFIKKSLKYLEGTVIKLMTLKPRDFLLMKCCIPCIEEQEKIADFLSTVDEVIAQFEAEVQNLEQQKKAAMQKIFSQEVRFKREDGTDYPEWEEKPFVSFCDVITKQTGFDYTKTIKRTLLTEQKDGTLPYLQTKNFTGINFDYSTDYYIPIEVANQFERIILDRKCLLFSIVGASVGNIALFPNTVKCFLSGAICVAKPIKEEWAAYLYHFMCSELGQSQIRNATKGSGQATITIEDIRAFSIKTPCLEEQRKIADFLSAYDEAISYAKQELDKWKELKKGLLQQMFV